MDSLQLAEFNEAFSYAFPEFLKPLVAITVIGIVVYVAKRLLRIN
jgi:hypothetical protein